MRRWRIIHRERWLMSGEGLIFIYFCFNQREHTFMTSTLKEAHVLKFVTCLQIPLFLNNKFIVHYLRMKGLGSHKIVHFFVGVTMVWTRMGCFSMLVFFDWSLLETARFSSAIFFLIRLNWKSNYCHYVINDIWWNEGSSVTFLQLMAHLTEDFHGACVLVLFWATYCFFSSNQSWDE